MENNQYIEVVPLAKLPRSLEVFDYRVPKNLLSDIAICQIVEIPFRKKNINGLVVGLKKNPDIENVKIKDIIKIKENKFLSYYHLDLARFMSHYYYQSLPLILKSILPQIPKKIIQKNHHDNHTTQDEREPQKILYDILLEEKKPMLVAGDYPTDLPISLVDGYIQKNKQVLLLFPEIALLEVMYEKYALHFGKSRIGIIGGTISKNAFYEQWKKILRNEIQIVMGTRRAVFSPFSNLGLIIIDSEEDPSYKQWDQNPRYHARDVAIELSRLTQAKLILFSKSPAVTTYSKTLKNFSYKFFPWKNKKIEIINLKNEKNIYPTPYISERIIEEIKNTKGQVLCMINRKGMANMVICKNCGYIYLCRSCRTHLTYYTHPSYMLICNSCKNKIHLPQTCPVCDGVEMYYLFPGTKKIAEELQQLFPKYAIETIDSDATNLEKRRFINGFMDKSVKILIATQAIFNDLSHCEEIDFAAILSTDILFNRPEYFSEEYGWQFLIKSMTLAKNTYVETNNAQSQTLLCFKELKFDSWYLHELKNRKTFMYPPFSRIIKIIFQNSLREKANSDAQIFSVKMKYLIQKNNFHIEFFGPLEPRIPKIRKNYRVNVILKILQKEENISKLMKLVPDSCLIDVDPISLL